MSNPVHSMLITCGRQLHDCVKDVESSMVINMTHYSVDLSPTESTQLLPTWLLSFSTRITSVPSQVMHSFHTVYNNYLFKNI